MNRAVGSRSARYAFLLGVSLVPACDGLNDDVSLGAYRRDQDPSAPRFAGPPTGVSSPVFVPNPGAGECVDLADACPGGPDGGSGGPEPWIVVQEGLVRMVLDATHLYWASTSLDDHAIWRADRVSGQRERIVALPTSGFGFAVDATHLYFTVRPDTVLQSTGSIRRMPKSGGTVEVLVSAIFHPTNVTLDDTHVYYNVGSDDPTAVPFPSFYGQVHRVAKDGGQPELVASKLENPWDFKVDATHLYLSEMNAGRVQRYPKTGGVATTLFQTYATDDVVLGGDFAYFTVCPAASCERGSYRLMRVPQSGGDAELLHEVGLGIADIAMRSDAVVWGNWLVAVDGSAASRLVPDAQQIVAVAADASQTFLGNHRGAIYKLDH